MCIRDRCMTMPVVVGFLYILQVCVLLVLLIVNVILSRHPSLTINLIAQRTCPLYNTYNNFYTVCTIDNSLRRSR